MGKIVNLTHQQKLILDEIGQDDFLKVEEFEFLPKMLVPLELQELQNFYHQLAKKLGLKMVER